MTTDRAENVDRICAAVRSETGDLAELTEAAVRTAAPLATVAERRELLDAALARMSGLDELDALVADTTIDEVLVNGREIWVDRGGRLVHVGELAHTSVEQLAERILAPIGRRVDRTSPVVDARLGDGSRVCVVVEPVAIGGAALSIRRFATSIRPLTDFTDDTGTELLHEILTRRCNLVVSGATSSGKTSLLAALLERVEPGERLVVLEDTAELPCAAEHLVRLEARPSSVEGLDAVTLADLVRTALRLRPDRLVVGEVRGDEVLGLVQAMNTGHDGSCSTCHANGALDALLRLESLVLQAAPQWPLAAVRQQLARSIDVIVHVTRVAGRRRVDAIEEVDPTTEVGAPPRLRTLGRHDGNRFVRHAALSRGRR